MDVMCQAFKLLGINRGDMPELDSYLVEHESMVYFVLADPTERPGQKYIACYPAEARYLAARFRPTWEEPAQGEEIPARVLQRIKNTENKTPH